MKIDIVIPSKISMQELEPLLDSIEENYSEILGEVIVVFNPERSPEEGTKRQRQYPLRVLNLKRSGVNRARNAGLTAAKNEIILFLDSDCRVANASFFAMHGQAHQSRDVAAFGGTYRSESKLGVFGETYELLQLRWFLSGMGLNGGNKRLLGGNASYKTSILRDNPFDESIEFGAAETELNFRLSHLGYKLIGDPKCMVRHENPLTLRQLVSKAWAQGKNSGRFSLRDKIGDEGLITQERLSVEDRLESNRAIQMAADIYGLVFELGYCLGSRRSMVWYLCRTLFRKVHRRLSLFDAALEYRWRRALKRQ